jgi:hypothetical protein
MNYNNYKIKYLSIKNELKGGVKEVAAFTETISDLIKRNVECPSKTEDITKQLADISNNFNKIANNFPNILQIVFANIYRNRLSDIAWAISI